jgi:hypothetical protein
MSALSKINLLAVTVAGLVIIGPGILLYFLLGDIFWSILLLIGCCLIIIPFFSLFGLSTVGIIFSPSRFLSGLLSTLKNRKRRSIDMKDKKPFSDK